MLELAQKVALVTGGARDIGRAVSLRLAELGAAVAVNYRSDAAAAEEVVRTITQAGGRAIAVPGDVTVAADVGRLVAATRAQLGGSIDILVNIAGGLVGRKAIGEMDEAFWDHVLALNLKSVFLVTKAVLPHMPDGGAIVNFSSQAGRDGGGPGASAYAAAKAGVLNYSRALAKELAPRRIRVNTVSPGMIATKFHDTFTKPEVRQRVAAMTPLGREGTAAEVADLTAFLASSRASFINGEAIEINGGIFFA
ncbi:SDR family oxidoreductase [Opitutus sp. ER46]|uniref:SDR family NAD(P)-dependent oxidoreductase n=1 Tax=Opitutus sp. ER46 TaxID=2161864 RepID=UPI000D31D183|nr:SDR family oxidoreductase [Opitutus sp. ER46]PTX96650.1 oxidoreductase [Opitutus sp. ER46]